MYKILQKHPSLRNAFSRLPEEIQIGFRHCLFSKNGSDIWMSGLCATGFLDEEAFEEVCDVVLAEPLTMCQEFWIHDCRANFYARLYRFDHVAQEVQTMQSMFLARPSFAVPQHLLTNLVFTVTHYSRKLEQLEPEEPFLDQMILEWPECAEKIQEKKDDLNQKWSFRQAMVKKVFGKSVEELIAEGFNLTAVLEWSWQTYHRDWVDQLLEELWPLANDVHHFITTMWPEVLKKPVPRFMRMHDFLEMMTFSRRFEKWYPICRDILSFVREASDSGKIPIHLERLFHRFRDAVFIETTS